MIAVCLQRGACTCTLILTSLKFNRDAHLNDQHSSCFTNPTAEGRKHEPRGFDHTGGCPDFSWMELLFLSVAAMFWI